MGNQVEQAETPAAPAARVELDYAIHVSHASKLNLADFQNAVPLLRELALVNHSAHEVTGLQLRLVSFPPFLKPKTWLIDASGPKSRYGVVDCDVQLDGALLGKLTEAETSIMTFTLVSGAGSEQEQVLATLERQVELLARNQWGGLSHLPDLVAAFVQPNEPAIDRLLKQAAEVLREAGKPAALDGYEGGARRAWELTSALWTAVARLGIDYALPPASFEQRGQKVRSAAQLIDGRIATCLDLALLFCSVLEQAGLNPVIVFTKGHAVAGVWLRQEEFSTVVVDDVTAIRKRLRLQELVLFETTLATARPAPSFTHATEVAAGQLAEAVQDQFELLVDIRRARMQRIKPLASLDSHNGDAAGDAATPATAAAFDDAVPDLPDQPLQDAAALDPKDRLARWQRKLLDLSLRNNLLNFRSGKKTLRLDAPEPAALEDALAAGAPIRLVPRPELMEGSDPRNQALHEQRSREDVRREHALDALARREVFVSVDAQELEVRLVDLYRSARTTLQEGGANTLFLALGFLNWTRDDKAGQVYKAPLILVPVSLQRKSARSGFTLSLHEDEPRFNPTLVEMLRQDFQLNLGVTDGVLPRDGAGLDVAQIWRTVSHAVRDIKGWEVTDEVVLAPFSFAKYLMWVDLAQRTDQLRASPVVRHLIDTPREPYLSTSAFPSPQRLDADYAPDQTFCPLPADSSQLSAVMAGAKGKDFVLIGPPGTGKSQTIANLIAQCLAEGKRVLFVSEKIAALDVVYRRLREVGLGEFCLELHSSKARKLDVINQLHRAWDAQGDADPEVWRAQSLKLKRLRDELNQYVQRLHQRHRNGLSIFQAIGHVVDGDADGVPRVELTWSDADVHDRLLLDALRELTERLAVNAAAVGQQHLQGGPLMAIAQTEWTPSWQQALAGAVRTTMASADDLQQALLAVQNATGLAGLPTGRQARVAIADLVRVLPDAFGHQWSFVFLPEGRAALGRLWHALAAVAHVPGQAHTLATAPAPALAAIAQPPVPASAPARTSAALAGSGWTQAASARSSKAQALLSEPVALMNALGKPWAADIVAELERGLQLLGELKAAESALSVPYGEPVEQLDVQRLQRAWRDAEASIWPLSWSRKRQLGKLLADCMLPGSADAEPDAAQDLGLLVRIRELRAAIDAAWSELENSEAAVARVLAFEASVSSAIASLAESEADGAVLRQAFDMLVGDGNTQLAPGGAVVTAGKRYLAASGALHTALEHLARTAMFSVGVAMQFDELAIDELTDRCARVLAAEPRLKSWCAWRKVRSEAQSQALGPLVGAIEIGAVAPRRALHAFEINYSRWWLNRAVDNDDVIRTFVSAEHEKRIGDFRALDRQFTDLTRAWVRAQLCAGMPRADEVTRNSEWGVLRHEIGKKKQHMPLRELMHSIPTALAKLAPCLLMSPLSIAQYLAADTDAFDLVVFDEASQIPVWDAIGAMARGKQVVMVGDPKQLPPTSFFDRADASEDDEDVEVDLESILDECMGANLPTMHLAWHYRSRNESLIAFSNHRYYGGGLVTFPSPVAEDRAVSFHHVAGVYDKGGARTNVLEAKALVADIVAKLTAPGFRDSKLTIGVVTFNTEQMHLIEDLLDEERRRDPALEPYFIESELEPLFVKNLESVQGDERDIIYFSVTYGPDQGGGVSMNFGPMNRDGGERRLNVAITRARQELRVFSSLKGEQFDLSRTQAAGVRDLKHFLEFAERGPRALAEATRGSQGGFDSPFEEAVAAALAARGWRVDTQVGASSFRVDLAIVHPDTPGVYLCGVECDGATYHRSATARDRDLLREQVLRGLGWEILRIWSTDWWIDREGTLDQVHGELARLLEASRG